MTNACKTETPGQRMRRERNRRIIRLTENGVATHVVAERCSLSEGRVCEICLAAGVKASHATSKWRYGPNRSFKALYRLLHTTKTEAAIAREVGCSRERVRQTKVLARLAGFTVRPTPEEPTR